MGLLVPVLEDEMLGRGREKDLETERQPGQHVELSAVSFLGYRLTTESVK